MSASDATTEPPEAGAPVELEPDMAQALADLNELKELSLRFGYDLFGALASLAESNAPFILGEIDDAATARAGHAVACFKLAERLDGALMALRARNGNAHVGHEVTPEMIEAGLEEYLSVWTDLRDAKPGASESMLMRSYLAMARLEALH